LKYSLLVRQVRFVHSWNALTLYSPGLYAFKIISVHFVFFSTSGHLARRSWFFRLSPPQNISAKGFPGAEILTVFLYCM